MFVGFIQGKIWGTTQCIFHHDNVEMHRIEVKPGGYCSIHHHRNKFNMFYIERGQLLVRIFRGDNVEAKPTDTSTLTAGMFSLIKPGERHQFEAVHDTVAYEVYWSILDTEDIVRDAEGGIRESGH